LWHVQKAWAKNVMKKIIGQETICEILKNLGNIIYNKDSLVGVGLISLQCKVIWIHMEQKS
jgi:hypothetical protein